MKIHLGVNNCFGVKRWPEAEEWLRIVVEEFSTRYVQFSFDIFDPLLYSSAKMKECHKIRSLSEKFGIKIVSTFTGLAIYSFNHLLHPDTGLRRDAMRWMEEAIYATAEMGAKGFGGVFSALSVRDYQDESRRKFLYEVLLDSLCYFSEVGMKVGLEFLLWEPTPLARELCHTIEEAKTFYKKANERSAIPILFCLDVGHACAPDIQGSDRDPYVWLKEIGSISPLVHIQQTDGQYDNHWPFTYDYNQRGIIEPNKVIDALQISGTKEVTLLLEINHPFEENDRKVLSDWKQSIEFWRNSLVPLRYNHEID